jgi:hypothetical protein
VHDGLGHAHRALGRLDLAGRHWRQALDLLAELGAPASDDVTAADIRSHRTAVGAAERPAGAGGQGARLAGGAAGH